MLKIEMSFNDAPQYTVILAETKSQIREEIWLLL